MNELICHFVGDYILQSEWMAHQKTKSWLPAILHAFAYSIPFTLYFIVCGMNLFGILIIGSTHLIIDRYRLAKYVCWFSGQLAPIAYRTKFTPTGYAETTPEWLSFILLIIVDNTLHLIFNRIGCWVGAL